MRRTTATLLTAALFGCGSEPLPPEPPVAADPAGLRVSLGGPDQLLLGRTTRVQVGAYRQSGAPVEIDGRISFHSTVPQTLTVDTAGLVTVADSGSGYIVASAEVGGRTLADSVRIVGIDPGFQLRIAQPGHPHHYNVPQTGPIVVTSLSRQGDTIPPPLPVTIRSTDTSVYRVNADSTISAIYPGEAYIIASAMTPYGEVADSLRMLAVCVGIQMDLAERPANPFRVGMSFPMEATIRICNQAIEIRPPTSWQSSNPEIVEIDSVNRKVRAVAPGHATIVVTAFHNGSAIQLNHIPLTVEPAIDDPE